jgi:hypothetical protein
VVTVHRLQHVGEAGDGHRSERGWGDLSLPPTHHGAVGKNGEIAGVAGVDEHLPAHAGHQCRGEGAVDRPPVVGTGGCGTSRAGGHDGREEEDAEGDHTEK